MSPVQQLHDWCDKHGFSYRYEAHRQIFILLKGTASLHEVMAVSLRELENAAGQIEALLYAMSA